PTALVARLTRSSMLEILHRDFIRTGRAKGLTERSVVLWHALRNAAIPVLTVIGLQIGALLGGAVITESVFAWPGMGKLIVDAIFFRDFPVVQTVLILSATVFVAIHLMVELLYTLRDPRFRSALRRWLAPPLAMGGTRGHVLGTDNLGRDILARLLYGGRISLALAVSAVLIAAVAGVLVGLVASWGGGRADAVIMRVADVQLAFPVIMLAIAIVAVVGTNPLALVGVLALSGWVLYARTVRTHVLTIRSLERVEAA